MSKPLTKKERAALNKKIKEEMQAERERQQRMNESLKKEADIIELVSYIRNNLILEEDERG